MITARADVVGSLLRPAELLRAREALDAGRIAPAELRAVEDRAVAQAVALQEESGLEVVTDGEMRRLSFQSQLTAAAAGFGAYDLQAFLWGEWYGDERVGDLTIARPATLGVVEKLRRTRYPFVEEFRYLQVRTTRVPKVTLPSPSLFANFWSPTGSAGAYPTLDAFLGDVADLLRDEISRLVELGATYLQLDAPHYMLLLDPKTRAFYEARGWSVDGWLRRGVELDNAVMAGFPGVTFGLHLCRGNQESRWLTSGSYEPLARPIFGGIHAQRLLLEYDDERSGTFAALRAVPDDKIAVLGLVTTKSPRVETPEELERRILQASRFVPLERLALSPQCGFSTSIRGNRLTVEDQRRKLSVIAETARRVWA